MTTEQSMERMQIKISSKIKCNVVDLVVYSVQYALLNIDIYKRDNFCINYCRNTFHRKTGIFLSPIKCFPFNIDASEICENGNMSAEKSQQANRTHLNEKHFLPSIDVAIFAQLCKCFPFLESCFTLHIFFQRKIPFKIGPTKNLSYENEYYLIPPTPKTFNWKKGFLLHLK